MKPAESFLKEHGAAASFEPGARGTAAGVRAESLPVRIAAAVVLFAAVSSLVWYCVDAVLAL